MKLLKLNDQAKKQSPYSPYRWYVLSITTLSMAFTFAVWSALSPLAPILQQDLHLTHTEISILIALPILSGSILRIPIGILTDRYGGKKIFAALLLYTLIPMFALETFVSTYPQLLVWGLLLGAAGTSFAIGIPYLSKWFPPENQGLALGLFGMGNGGTAIASFLAPQIAQNTNWHFVFFWFSLLIILALFLFLTIKKEPRPSSETISWLTYKQILCSDVKVWILSFLYFVTFGLFVAFSNYIPKLVTDVFNLPKTYGGSLAGIFVILATLTRPLGGWLSDHIDAKTILSIVFAILSTIGIVLSLDLSLPLFSILLFVIACAAGTGNGAVFKLVALYYPKYTGIVTGIVGAAGGLGGFFPPLILGLCKDQFDTYAYNFIFLSIFALLSLYLNQKLRNQL
ncbi:nitrate/nitrite transporter [Desulfitobacterium sp. Sab5]|uniref:MFS transporter n=1 Tax=Desulfitobacterium nosdiversum TaxID=3375356 RepID=UPI003CF2BC38